MFYNIHEWANFGSLLLVEKVYACCHFCLFHPVFYCECQKVKTSNVKQILANWGPNSRFAPEAIIRALISKLSRCSILKTRNHLNPIHDSQPNWSLPDYQIMIPNRVICPSLISSFVSALLLVSYSLHEWFQRSEVLNNKKLSSIWRCCQYQYWALWLPTVKWLHTAYACVDESEFPERHFKWQNFPLLFCHCLHEKCTARQINQLKCWQNSSQTLVAYYCKPRLNQVSANQGPILSFVCQVILYMVESSYEKIETQQKSEGLFWGTSYVNLW